MKNCGLVVKTLLFGSLLSSSAWAGKPAWVEEKQQSRGKGSAEQHERNEQSQRAARTFSGQEQRTIQDYFETGAVQQGSDKKVKGHSKVRQLPPGLQKKLARGGELPPGWQSKVVAGQVLEQELYAQSEPLPEDLEGVLNRLPGEEHRRIGNKVIRILEGNGSIVDVIDLSDAVLQGSHQ